MIWKVLKKEFKGSHLLVITLVMLTGFVIILLAGRFYADIRPTLQSEDIWEDEHLVISKKVSSMNTAFQALGKKQNAFSEKELKEIDSQSFVTDMAPFVSNSFKASMTLSAGGKSGLRTEMFFEAIPSRFLDVTDDDWEWTPQSRYVPVILPKTYLNLYNFGFAKSQGLPQISEGAAGMLNLKVIIKGNQQREELLARVTGFSDRLNTILVPLEFLSYANAKYGEKTVAPSRVMLVSKDPSNAELLNFLERENYDYNKEKLSGGKARALLNTVSGLVLLTGLAISVLALWMFILSTQLLIQKNKTNIHYLIVQGYSHRQVLMPFVRQNGVVLLLVFGLSIIPYLLLRNWWRQALEKVMQNDLLADAWILSAGILLLLLLGSINIRSIYKQIRKTV